MYSNGGFVLNGNCKKTSLKGKAYIIKNMLFNWFFAYGLFSGVGLGMIGYFRQFESYDTGSSPGIKPVTSLTDPQQ